ncbi:MAG: hypothetical protein ACK4WJ_06465 [Endomicrobiia bacterium]
MVSKIKKIIWKIQDYFSSLYYRAAVDFWFHILTIILLITIIYLIVSKK